MFTPVRLAWPGGWRRTARPGRLAPHGSPGSSFLGAWWVVGCGVWLGVGLRVGAGWLAPRGSAEWGCLRAWSGWLAAKSREGFRRQGPQAVILLGPHSLLSRRLSDSTHVGPEEWSL